MPQIPAVCEKCGKAYNSQVWIKDSTYHIRDHVAGECECGGQVRILDGTYTHLGGPINFCNAPEETKTKFQELCSRLAECPCEL